MQLTTTLLYCTLALTTWASAASDVPADLQTLHQQRTQQQLELQLKMQQQHDRASRPPESASSDLQRRTLELDQRQRQQQQFDEASRATLGVHAGDGLNKPPPEAANARTANAAADQLQRFERERQMESERPTGSSSAAAPRTSERPF
jgi:hypothetical protein